MIRIVFYGSNYQFIYVFIAEMDYRSKYGTNDTMMNN